jgi:uncharacterized protein (DUF433 family)
MATREIAASTPPGTPLPSLAQDGASDEDLIDVWIEPDPRKPWPGDARVRGYFVHVWALIGHQRATNRELEAISHDYGLPAQAVEAALAYYRRHRQSIDARLDENDA